MSTGRAFSKRATRDLVAAEETLRTGEERLREILDSAPVAFIASDAEGLVLDWNREAELIFGWARADAIGRHLASMLLPPAVRCAYEREISDLLEADDPKPQARRLQLTAVNEEGSEIPVEMTIARVAAPEGVVFRAYVRDITAQWQADRDRRYAEEQLAYQAIHDPLTGLPNRALLLDRVSHALALAARHGTTAAVLYADIDNFKLVNNSLGHEVGDELIVRVAHRLQGVLRVADTVAAIERDTLSRVSGDEFVILCESLAMEATAIDIAARISSAFEEPFDLAGERLFVTLSIGIALTGPGSTAASLIRDADAAVQRAKELGGGRYELFDPEIRDRVCNRIRKETELRYALEREELRVHFQPIVSAIDGGIVGAEALLRWEHPEHGLLSPAEFIPLAEDTGLIVPIGRWVLETAWAQLATWHATLGPRSPLHVSVNISPRQVMDDDLVALVGQLLEQHRLAPSRLILEVTERILLQDTESRVTVLRELQDLGVRLALDDFGTGYSSLAYLRRLPFDVLKLDRSFISGLGHTSTDLQIVAAVVDMSRALTMTVIAEGVEEPEQLECLRRLGCHFAQGYYFAKPMPAEEFGRALTGNRPEASPHL